MAVDFTVMVPREMHDELLRLGRRPTWVRVEADASDILPRTIMHIDHAQLNDLPLTKAVLRSVAKVTDALVIDSLAVALVEGPKLFVPTAEQFESMMHVDITLPPRDVRFPFNALLIQVPTEAKRALATKHGVDVATIPSHVFVRRRAYSNEPHSVIVCVVKFANSTICNAFQDQAGNPTVESAITRIVRNENDARFDMREHHIASDMFRAAINLGLMLTNRGCAVKGPVDPAAYAKHRAKPALRQFAPADLVRVELTQETVVRDAAPRHGSTPSGREMSTHWRRGHWRRLPGWEAYHAQGQSAPITFIRPTLVRADKGEGPTDAIYKDARR